MTEHNPPLKLHSGQFGHCCAEPLSLVLPVTSHYSPVTFWTFWTHIVQNVFMGLMGLLDFSPVRFVRRVRILDPAGAGDTSAQNVWVFSGSTLSTWPLFSRSTPATAGPPFWTVTPREYRALEHIPITILDILDTVQVLKLPIPGSAGRRTGFMDLFK